MDENIFYNQIQAETFKFLDVKGYIKELEHTCDLYQQKLNALSHQDSLFPFCYTLKLNFQEFCDIKELLYVITKEIELFLRIFKELLKNFANKYFGNSNTEIFIKSEQVHCNLRIIDLPIQQYRFSLRDTHIKRCLSTFHCIIFSITPPSQYIRQSVWKCNSCFNQPLIVQRNFQDSHSSHKCLNCTSDCEEIFENRLLSEFSTAQVYEADQIKNRKNYSAIKTLEIILLDDLCQELKIGQEYRVTGIFEVQQCHYKVFNITPI